MKKILITSILLLFGTIANAANEVEMTKVFNEVRSICPYYLQQCEPHLVISNSLQAVTHKEKNIYISSGLVKLLDEDELRAVMYHEVGHAVLRHTTREANWLVSTTANGNYSKEAYNNLRRTHEYEADRFASYTLKLMNRNNKLSEALFKIVPSQYWGIEFPTHPATTDRVHRIKMIINK